MNAFRTKEDAEAWVMQLRDAHRDPETGDLYARDPIHRAMGKAYISRCVAFTSKGRRVAAWSVQIGA
jgi:hypothetical protein